MLSDSAAFSGFSSNEIEKSIAFYRDVLGLELEEGMGGFTLVLAGGARVFVYPKADHVPASFTVLNFPVEDIDATVAELNSRGVETAIYDDPRLGADSRGIARGRAGFGPDIAWFRDPAGNVLSVLAEPRAT